jgi:hypothetical protein
MLFTDSIVLRSQNATLKMGLPRPQSGLAMTGGRINSLKVKKLRSSEVKKQEDKKALPSRERGRKREGGHNL